MRYCIHQTSFESSEMKESIVDKVYSVRHFFHKINNFVKNKYSTYKLVELTSLDMIKNTEKLIEGIYLLDNKTNMQLVQKNKIVREGYIYNSIYYETKNLFIWRLIPIEKFSFDDNTNLSQINQQETETAYREIKTFDMDKIKNAKKYIISAKRGSGKSYIVSHLISYLNDNDNFIKNSLIISPTERMNPFYIHRFPQAKIIYQFDDDIVQEYIKNEKVCIVCDDCF